MAEVKINKDVFNSAYYKYLNCNTRTQIFFGGSSSGKSFAIVGQRTVYDILKGGRNYLIVRNVARTSRQSTFNEVKKAIANWGVGELFSIHKSELTITCANGYQIMFAGLDDVEKLKSITPVKGVITDVIIEEATEARREDTKQLEKRLRGRAKVLKRLVLIFNPILKSHWLFQEYFTGKFDDNAIKYHDKKLLILKTTYKDNAKFLENDDIEALENEPDEYFHSVYTLGNWGTLGGVIFKRWKIEDLTDQIPFFDNIRNGLDFGFSNHPTAYTKIHYDGKRKKIYIFDEFHGLGLTNPEIADLLKPLVNKERIVCDSAEPKSVAELSNCGINAVGAVKGPGSINFGIQWLQQHEIIIHKGCQETINEFQLYQWKKDKGGQSTNVPIDKFNHFCLVAGTKIDTIRGKVDIEDIKIGDMVLTRAGYKRVVDSQFTGVNKVQTYIVCGNKITMTPDHSLITNCGKVAVKDLTIKHTLFIKEDVLCQKKLVLTELPIQGIRKHKDGQIEFITDVPGVTIVRGLDAYIETSIFSTTAKLIKAVTSIIEMAIRSTTISAIWKWFKEQNTYPNILKSIISKIKRLFSNIFVVTNVNQAIEGRKALITKQEFVLSAGRNFQSISTVKQFVVHATAPPSIGGIEKTYNITVEDHHEYFANNICVSNCDAIRYALEDDMIVTEIFIA